jgi:general secretion pathway protein G
VTTRRRGQDGYTLTEMLVVIGIIGLIAAVLVPAQLGQMARARAKAAQLQLKAVSAAVEQFKDDVGRLPSKEEGLAALLKQPPTASGWTGPYVEGGSSLKDPWGEPLILDISSDARHYHIRTLGADEKPGGEGADRDLAYPDEAP